MRYYLIYIYSVKYCPNRVTQIFLTKTHLSSTSNPKLFWNFIKELKRKNSFPVDMYLNNDIALNGSDITNLFSCFLNIFYLLTLSAHLQLII